MTPIFLIRKPFQRAAFQHKSNKNSIGKNEKWEKEIKLMQSHNALSVGMENKMTGPAFFLFF
jgi:hypothetical protein